MPVKKEIKVDVSKHIEKSEELIKMMEKLKKDKKLLFHIYDSLKGFDLIMSGLGKEKLLEYFVMYMKDTEEKQKNYSKFVSFIYEKEGKDFIGNLRNTYNGIVKNYDSIKFGNKSFHFGSEEIYLRETLEKIKSILESLGELKEKSLIKINLSFLAGSNSNLDFKFNDSQLEEIGFYARLDEIDEDTNQENLLPFFHLLNNLTEELKITEERVVEMIEDSKKELQKDTDVLYKNKETLEKDAITLAKKELKSYLSKKTITELTEIIEESANILENIQRNKNLPEGILIKDIQTLEDRFDQLQKIV